MSEIHLAVFNSGSPVGWKQCSEPRREPAGGEHLGVAAPLAGGAAPTPALCSHLFPPNTPAHLKASLVTTSDLKHRNQEFRVRADGFLSCFALPELGPVARLCGRGSVHSGTCWTRRLCLLARRAASACGSQQRFGPIAFSSAESKKRADGNMEGISSG